jgi:hypothetical protein
MVWEQFQLPLTVKKFHKPIVGRCGFKAAQHHSIKLTLLL